MTEYLIDDAAGAIPLRPLTPAALGGWLQVQDPRTAAWVEANRFTAAAGKTLLVPDGEGRVREALAGVEPEDDLWVYGGLAGSLPEGVYRLVEEGLDPAKQSGAALG